MAFRQPEKEKRWAEIFEEQANSGQSIANFCIEREIRPNQFYWWRRRLKNEKTASEVPAGFIELVSASNKKSGNASGVTLILDNRFRFQLDPDFNSAMLKKALMILSEPLQ